MKNIKSLLLITVSVCFLFVALISCEKKDSENPFNNTQWMGMAKIPQESEVLLKFTKDRLDLYFENRVIESMNYSLKGDHIFLEKISGGSPCEKGKKGEYKYEIVSDSFIINLVKDDCVARTMSLKDNVFKRTTASK